MKYHDVVIGVDPACGVGEVDDYFAAAVLGTDDTGQIHLLEMIRTRQHIPGQLHELRELAIRWRPRRIGMEMLAYDHLFGQAAIDSGLPVTPIRGSLRKSERIGQAATRLRDGSIAVPMDAPWLPALQAEVHEYPEGVYDDQLDALARAIETALALQGTEIRTNTTGGA